MTSPGRDAAGGASFWREWRSKIFVGQSNWPEQRGSFSGQPGKRNQKFSIGEFDSGSERTLAAWIRHASRTRFSRLAITGKIEWRMGA